MSIPPSSHPFAILAFLRERGDQLSGVIPVVVLLGLVGVVIAAQPAFLSPYGLRVILGESSAILLLATGLTIVIIIGGIDLSIAALASFASIIVALTLPRYGLIAVAATLMMTTLLGGIQGYVHAKAQVPSFVVTLAGMGLWSGFGLAIALGSVPVSEGYALLSWLKGNLLGIPISFLGSASALIILGAIVSFSPLGRHIYAIGLGESASLLSGIRVTRIKVTVFAIAGLFSGLTAMLMVARNASGHPTLVHGLLLPSIAAVVVGGTAITGGFGSLGRTLFGVLIVTVLRVGMTVAGLDAGYEPLVYGSLIIVAVALTTDRSKNAVVK